MALLTFALMVNVSLLASPMVVIPLMSTSALKDAFPVTERLGSAVPSKVRLPAVILFVWGLYCNPESPNKL